MLKITLDKTNWSWDFTFSLSADAVGAESVFDLSAAGHQVADLVVGKETEPGAVGRILAAFKALEFIFGRENVNILTEGALTGNKTLEVLAVSGIWKADEKKYN